MKQLRVLRLLAALGAVAVLGAACTAGGDGASVGANAARVDVTLGEFSIKADGEAPARRSFSMVVRNSGAVPHSLAVEAAGKRFETRMLNSQESATLALPALEPGSYRLWCTVPGHAEAGMESRLLVEAADGASKASGTRAEQIDIDAAHEAGIKAFPATTRGVGGVALEPALVDGVKVFGITTTALSWEVSPGKFVDAFAYNGQVPGPEIRVRKGDRIRVAFHNALPQSSSLHFHGVTVPNGMDGVTFINQPPVRTGERFSYEFTVVDDPGTYMYHSHHNAAVQVGKGLLGAFIIEPESPEWDVEQTMVLGDGPLGYTLNGKGFPATAPIVAGLGQRVRVRFMNGGQLIHPMHLHGFRLRVVARDGTPIAPYEVDTLSVAPGERYDAVFTATQAGTWAFHCHVLSHAESEHGMHGMVTAVVVK